MTNILNSALDAASITRLGVLVASANQTAIYQNSDYVDVFLQVFFPNADFTGCV